MEYSKPPKTLDEQIEIIKNTGLVIDDEEKLKKYLINISYYHLSAYFKSFQHNDKFKSGTTLENVINLYEFDKKLRLLLLDVLERIEKSFKCSVIYNLAIDHNNPHWYLDLDLYSSQENFDEFIEPLLEKNIKISKEVSIRHYYDKYSEPEYPPSWIALEVLTFGECVKLCRQLKRAEQNSFSRPFNIDRQFLISWMHGLSVVRNICAHYARIWNKNIALSLKLNHRIYGEFFNDSARAKLYNYLVVIQIMMCKINPTSSWVEKLENLVDEYQPYLPSMGFPGDWKERLEKISQIKNDKQ